MGLSLLKVFDQVDIGGNDREDDSHEKCSDHFCFITQNRLQDMKEFKWIHGRRSRGPRFWTIVTAVRVRAKRLLGNLAAALPNSKGRACFKEKQVR